MIFFNDFDWDALSKKTIFVPFKIKSRIEYEEINEKFTQYIPKDQQNKDVILKWYQKF